MQYNCYRLKPVFVQNLIRNSLYRLSPGGLTSVSFFIWYNVKYLYCVCFCSDLADKSSSKCMEAKPLNLHLRCGLFCISILMYIYEI
jgi:hypothetical protein